MTRLWSADHVAGVSVVCAAALLLVGQPRPIPFGSEPPPFAALARQAVLDRSQMPAELERVVDGDTYVLRIELGFDVLARAHVRLAGLDTPKRNTPEGAKAAAAVETFLRSGPITVVPSGERSFARYVAHVFVRGQSVAAWLKSAGHEKR